MLCDGIAGFGILLWCSGTRSLFFGKIERRKGVYWVASRWFGLGMWFTWTLSKPENLGLGFLGAICLFIGAIWKKSDTSELKQ